MSIKLGAFFPTRDMPAEPQAIRDWTQAAEDIGFDFVEVSDHVLGVERSASPGFQGPYDIGDAFHETFVTLAFMAAITERVGLTSGVLILPQRQTALVAKQAAQLDVVSGGRLRLGIGVGWNPVEYQALGENWSTRGRRQAEQVELLLRLWTERTVDFEGRFDTVKASGLNPMPIQRPIPLWFGGSAPAVLQRAATHGQGWIPLGAPDAEAESRISRLNEHLRAAGRDPSSFGIEAWVRSELGGPEAWQDFGRRWRELGATRLTFYTSGLGVGGVDAQIAAMRRYHEAMRALG